ncbi:MAG: hypothetical protein P2973_03850 [Gemmatimonadota bacterium]|nr:hypothetical protein [Gemmatimonadota bacterium]
MARAPGLRLDSPTSAPSDMYAAILHTHNALRWLVLVAGILAVLRTLQGLNGTTPFAAARQLGLTFTAALHLQVITGLTLFVVSPLIQAAMGDMPGTMKNAPLRFFIAEHPTLMVVAAIVATIGGIVAKNAPDDAKRHRKALAFTVATLALIFAGIPWDRPWMPGQ